MLGEIVQRMVIEDLSPQDAADRPDADQQFSGPHRGAGGRARPAWPRECSHGRHDQRSRAGDRLPAEPHTGRGAGGGPPTGFLLSLPSTLLILAVIVFPFSYVAGMSLFNEATGEFVETGNYRRVLGSTDFLPSVSVSLVWTVSNLVVQTVCGLALALFLNQRFAGRDAARTLFLVPFVVPTAVVALMFSWMLNSSFGVINHLILTSGLSDVPLNFLGDPRYAMPSLIAMNV
ncbi:MAG: sugar ABC transporter permease, partial [Singulisphaera sp.]